MANIVNLSLEKSTFHYIILCQICNFYFKSELETHHIEMHDVESYLFSIKVAIAQRVTYSLWKLSTWVMLLY